MRVAKCHKIVAILPSIRPVHQQAGWLKRVEAILGVRGLHSEQDLVRLVEGRLAIRTIEGLRRSGFTDDEMFLLVVPRRTLAHRRARRESLSREESDRVVRLARIAAFSQEVFGDSERSWRWLRAGKRQFDGRSPLQFAATEAGARLVEELLYRIDEGMAALVILWRISNHASLAGGGALRTSGRWHTRGRRVVYCALTPAAAFLEGLVHFEIELRDLPVRYRLLRIDAPADVAVERIAVASLPSDWTANVEVTRGLGDEWLASGRTPLLIVPSAIVPETFNALLNPSHEADRRVIIAGVSEHPIDPRLLK
jgi:putative toxin-antitoxin system antitoxin component (TIGR02293 family)